ncbi:transporter substrate-binding domain-containing protein [Secundilactobacillus collinoides]|uniref:L-cystine ABC superfamily ATP binding cassette transporter, binding protein YckK n=2 Tax=Secundilactobacillus collinoides TaxID=33960 RepID=A0A0R2B3K3_SECCO|nr:transporter substrate-binding domain-containing protein [Secundilactobacillus collinoides]KRM73330.1 L-cystine ABC superfamily ATP binding cassette transporter, binding protein YckK [Secundilactobacillus collinoides DSM 20515 = JCM 1123]KZL42545.1 amino acid ABC transporter substrate-binding protein [Secundilactobacillus collinoides]
MTFSSRLKKGLVIAGVALIGVALTACGSSSSSSNSGYKSELVHSNELTIGLEGTYSPYSYRKNGKLTGFEVQLGKAIAKKMGLKANFVPTKWDSLIAGLGSDKYDVVMNNITQTADRKKDYLFSTPYVYSKYVLITRSNDNSIKSTSDIKGKTFTQSTGSDNEIIAKKFGAKIKPVGDFTTELSLVKQKQADGIINAEAAWIAYKNDNSTKGLKERVLTSSEQKPAKISALFNKKDTKLKTKYNKALAEVRKDGTLKKLSEKYFGKDITTK